MLEVALRADAPAVAVPAVPPVRPSRHCSRRAFTLWLIPWVLLLAAGAFACLQCLIDGLHHTNMDNRYAFGLWIFLDLTVIALGAGAFTSGLLAYVFHWKEVRAVLHLAVLTGLLCYGGAVAILMVDVGQPLRAWFTFWHPNVHSMLAEVTFCLTCYLIVLAVEFVPILTRHRRLRSVAGVAVVGSRVHRGMVVLAVLGATLSFFHQGSLGGLYGVLQGRPFAFREDLWIFPTTFFLFVLSAMAIGPAFLVLIARVFEIVTRRLLVPRETIDRLARLSGTLLLVYLALKGIDTLVWLNGTVPESGVQPAWLYRQPPFGSWVLIAEFLVLGLVPALLLRRAAHESRAMITWAAVLGCAGIALNRLVATLQTLILPTLPFEDTWAYVPNWQETVAFAGVIALTVIVLSLAHRADLLFGRDPELEPSGSER